MELVWGWKAFGHSNRLDTSEMMYCFIHASSSSLVCKCVPSITTFALVAYSNIDAWFV